MNADEKSQLAREEYLRQVTLGELEVLDGPIVLADPDSGWPAQYEELALRIREALGNLAIVLEHVGSTSVPGLAAKPVIDIVLAVPDSTDEASYVAPLAARGFELRIREPDWFEHRLLRSTTGPAANVHVFSAGCEEIDRLVTFRDWLRAHDDDRKVYEGAKRALAARTWRHRQHYADAKSDVIRGILARAA
jgi:GrpB-like predicted nucleotidyltransferase (UPF0157 family)